MRDYVNIVRWAYDPAAFAGRLDRLADLLDRSGHRRELPTGDRRAKFASLEMIHRIISAQARRRRGFLANLAHVASSAIRWRCAIL